MQAEVFAVATCSSNCPTCQFDVTIVRDKVVLVHEYFVQHEDSKLKILRSLIRVALFYTTALHFKLFKDKFIKIIKK